MIVNTSDTTSEGLEAAEEWVEDKFTFTNTKREQFADTFNKTHKVRSCFHNQCVYSFLFISSQHLSLTPAFFSGNSNTHIPQQSLRSHMNRCRRTSAKGRTQSSSLCSTRPRVRHAPQLLQATPTLGTMITDVLTMITTTKVTRRSSWPRSTSSRLGLM